MREMLDALQQLERLSTGIFDNISKRVDQQRERLNRYQDRIRVARDKVVQVGTRNQATTIVSPAAYPSVTHSTDTPMFTGLLNKTQYQKINFVPPLPKTFKFVNPLSQIDTSILIKPPVTLDHPEDKKGLGRLPAHVQSISGLLLFNTGESVYEDYPVEADPLLGVEPSETLQHAETGLDAPPASLAGDHNMVIVANLVN
jgi:hypothetical protein